MLQCLLLPVFTMIAPLGMGLMGIGANTGSGFNALGKPLPPLLISLPDAVFDSTTIPTGQQFPRFVRYFYWRNLIDADLSNRWLVLVQFYNRFKKPISPGIAAGGQSIKIGVHADS